MASSNYDIPKWAGKSPQGFHLDVTKDGKLYQKLMVDEKSCYLFGRNVTMTDFCIDHASCSRVHASLVYHKHLDRFFLTDLGSTHGSHIGNIRLEPNKPTQLPVDSSFHFGASTRIYTLREKPNCGDSNENDPLASTLPESDFEIDNLTEYNTAQNRRISMLGIALEESKPATASKRKLVTFNEDEDIINPEDIDPSVGKFRNMVQTAIVPSRSKSSHKKARFEVGGGQSSMSIFSSISSKTSSSSSSTSSSSSLHSAHHHHHHSSATPLISPTKSFGIHLPNPAPEIEIEVYSNTNADKVQQPPSLYDANDLVNLSETPLSYDDVQGGAGSHHDHEQDQGENDLGTDPFGKKKKYAKEAWPGRKNFTPLTNF